jgi:hypothetical protein
MRPLPGNSTICDVQERRVRFQGEAFADPDTINGLLFYLKEVGVELFDSVFFITVTSIGTAQNVNVQNFKAALGPCFGRPRQLFAQRICSDSWNL